MNSKLPKNLGIIMDGNRRWAKLNGYPIIKGHYFGTSALKKIIKKCSSLGIKELTVFAFSTENWKRVPEEVELLIGLIERFIQSEIAELKSKNVKLIIIGDKIKFGTRLNKLFKKAEELTINNTGMKLNVALNYGGKKDILFGVKNIFKDIKTGKINEDDINEILFKDYLLSSDVGDIDLLIRTSGEQRISNFLLWQIAYTEFYFTDTLWPDFNENELEKALIKYEYRDRRFGSTSTKKFEKVEN
ncbi:MAG: hypothetical protein CMP38_02785 [Rickettsiales bacterium]|nr:hypothetical protein [Rickettsiales bacterium]|tara:strand:- start:1234 stop:1968 length:735 start_codon:yes stop_codon:yes gene_type:complete